MGTLGMQDASLPEWIKTYGADSDPWIVRKAEFERRTLANGEVVIIVHESVRMRTALEYLILALNLTERP